MKKTLLMLLVLALALAVLAGCDDTGLTSGTQNAEGSTESGSGDVSDISLIEISTESDSGDISDISLAESIVESNSESISETSTDLSEDESKEESKPEESRERESKPEESKEESKPAESKEESKPAESKEESKPEESREEESRPDDIPSVCYALPPEELLAEFDRLGFELDMPDFEALKDGWPSDAVLDGRKYDWKYKLDPVTNKETTEKIFTGFWYDAIGPDGIFITIYYDNDGDFKCYNLGSCPTPEGVDVGDDFGKMLEIYGDDYTILLSKPKLYDESNPKISFRYDYEGEYIVFNFSSEYSNTEESWGIDMGNGKILNVHRVRLWTVVGEPYFEDHNFDIIDKEVENRS